ncbi:MAG TPA: DUF423 domain-containing protein [Steroidobacteraceae bacterium]
MNARTTLVIAGILIALATMFGAFGAHALKGRLTPDQLAVYETAVRYHFYHALGLLGIGAASQTLNAPMLGWAAALILVGIVLFSGSLYAITFGAPRGLGIITPIGGVAMIVGWIVFAVAVFLRLK